MVYPNISPDELQKRYLEVTVWSYDIYRPNEFLGEILLDLSGRTHKYNTIFNDICLQRTFHRCSSVTKSQSPVCLKHFVYPFLSLKSR